MGVHFGPSERQHMASVFLGFTEVLAVGHGELPGVQRLTRMSMCTVNFAQSVQRVQRPTIDPSDLI